jgi:hypothetical protein
MDDKQEIHRENLLKSLRNDLAEEGEFTVSKYVNGFAGTYFFAVDETNEKIGFSSNNKKTFINFTDIIGVELIENGNVVIKKNTTRTIGGAIIGGVLAGGAGSIVGGLSGSSTQKNKVTSVHVKLLLRSIDKPSLNIICFESWMNSKLVKTFRENRQEEDYVYRIGKRNAVEIKDLISVIIDRTDNKIKPLIEPHVSTPSNLIADELLKLNTLKEKGILTEEEFSLQKNKILNQ